MSYASQIASKEGVSPNDIEIIDITEQRVSETTVVRTITYLIRRRGPLQNANNFLTVNAVNDARAIAAFQTILTQEMQSFSKGDASFGDAYRAAMSRSLEKLRASKVPLIQPKWYSELKWSGPVSIENLPLLSPIPFRSGVYVFTDGDSQVVPGSNVLYVGVSGELRRRETYQGRTSYACC
jgi:hypothetical protein